MNKYTRGHRAELKLVRKPYFKIETTFALKS